MQICRADAANYYGFLLHWLCKIRFVLVYKQQIRLSESRICKCGGCLLFYLPRLIFTRLMPGLF